MTLQVAILSVSIQLKKFPYEDIILAKFGKYGPHFHLNLRKLPQIYEISMYKVCEITAKSTHWSVVILIIYDCITSTFFHKECKVTVVTNMGSL